MSLLMELLLFIGFVSINRSLLSELKSMALS